MVTNDDKQYNYEDDYIEDNYKGNYDDFSSNFNYIDNYNKTYANKPKMEFSKKILYITATIFTIQLIIAFIFTWFEKSTDIFIYSIPSCAGIFGASICFYLNKAKMENLYKGKIDFLKLRLEFEKQYPNTNTDNEFFDEIDEQIDSKINDTLTESINENINIQNFN